MLMTEEQPIHAFDAKPTKTILELARTFPCLDIKLRRWNPREFDSDNFAAMMSGWSHGEKLCGLFVLNVWDPERAKTMGWNFNVFDFVGTSDSESRTALIHWVCHPVWP